MNEYESARVIIDGITYILGKEELESMAKEKDVIENKATTQEAFRDLEMDFEKQVEEEEAKLFV